MLIGHRKFLIFLFLSNCIFHNITASESVATKKIVCYIGTDCSKRLGRGSFHINDLNADLCTHVILGFARLKDERTIDLLASWIEFMKGTNITSVKKKFPGVIFMVAVGGWYNGVQPFIKFTDHKENQKIFAQTALDFVKKHDFDGLELCWLYPTKRGGYISDRKTFVELLKARN
ncbi:endochitinase-like [Onthophagus taurus]|uniref:endochitinase-like n=1 Tax=Onthophagus taurus TaxID=166361 RepID=UPI0039BE7947